jgi:hypothetical protein
MGTPYWFCAIVGKVKLSATFVSTPQLHDELVLLHLVLLGFKRFCVLYLPSHKSILRPLSCRSNVMWPSAGLSYLFCNAFTVRQLAASTKSVVVSVPHLISPTVFDHFF